MKQIIDKAVSGGFKVEQLMDCEVTNLEYTIHDYGIDVHWNQED